MGDVTILVNNAAVVHGKSLLDSDDDALLKSQHINTMGQFWVSTKIKSRPNCFFLIREADMQTFTYYVQ